MKRRMLLALFSVLLVSSALFAQQQRVQVSPLTSINKIGLPIDLRQSGVNNHYIVWAASGTVSTCSVKLQQSVDKVTWTDLIAGATCTSNGQSALTAGVVNYVRVNATTLTGSGTLYVTYTGFPPGLPASASIAGDVTVIQPTGTNLHVVVDSGGGGGTQYTQDVALTVATTIGTMAMGRASAAVPTDVSADNDAVIPWYLRSGAVVVQLTNGGVLTLSGSGTATAALRVELASNGTGRMATVDVVTAVTAITNALPAGTNNIGKVDIPNALPVGSNNIGAINLQLAGSAAAVNTGAASATTLRVIPASDTVIQSISTSIVPGTGATNLGKAEDAVAGSGDTGVAILGVIQATLSAPAADGDYTVPKLNANGAAWVQSVFIDAAEGVAVATNPVPVGCVYRTSYTTLSVGNIGYPICDVNSRLMTIPTPGIQGGWTALNATAADGATACTSTVQAIKASQGTFGGYFINNPNTADSWLHIYNVASGSVTVGTTNPALTFRIPGQPANSVGANLEISLGVQFSTAMSMACTTTAGGNGNPSSALEADIFYK